VDPKQHTQLLLLLLLHQDSQKAHTVTAPAAAADVQIVTALCA